MVNKVFKEWKNWLFWGLKSLDIIARHHSGPRRPIVSGRGRGQQSIKPANSIPQKLVQILSRFIINASQGVKQSTFSPSAASF
jgi:hypothetical protein